MLSSAVFLSTAGVYLGHLVTQFPSSFLFTNLGIIALAGIVVNNNIVLVDTFNVLKKEFVNAPIKDLIIRTAAQRIRPIVLTTATTVVGLLPLALGLGVDLMSREIGIGGRSQARILSGIKAFYKYLNIEGITDVNPVSLLESPRLGRKLPDTLSVNEINQLIECIDLNQKVTGIKLLLKLCTLVG